MTLELFDAAYDDPVAAALIEAVQQEYVVRYGGPDGTPLVGEEFTPPAGVFLLARIGDELIGCAGLRRHDDGTVELKRMYIRRDHRGRGHGRALLHAVEDRARALGYRRLILETGTPQPEALALYVAQGYHRVANFGHYRRSPMSRCFGKDL
ncbi:GNAT family N-acetyltransferase [soil metagenome]